MDMRYWGVSEMARSRFFRFLLSLGILVLGVNGQNYNVTIVADPNMATYTVGDSLTLTCVVEPMPNSTSTVTYLWTCSDCFAAGMTVPNITRVLTDMEDDDIDCTVTIDGVGYMTDMMFALQVTQAPSPSISFNPPSPIQNLMVGGLLTIECRVDTIAGVNSLMISWTEPGGVAISNDTRVTISPPMRSGNTYISSLQFVYLMEGDEGTYTCNVMILQTRASESIELEAFTIPPPTVRVTALSTQTVGQSLILQCNVTTVRGITSRVDIVWSSGDDMLQRTNNVSSTTMGDSLVYTNSYTISQLNTTDDGRVIQCEVVINASPSVNANGSITLDVNVPTPNVTISPPGPIQGAMVGSPQVINCAVSTVSAVESSSVMISWMGPGGAITNDSRVTISPTTSSGNIHTSILHFTYLMEGDEGTYSCDVMIMDVIGSQSVELQLLTIPSLTVHVTAPSTQTVGQSLTLQCEVTTVRGITSGLDIVWRSSDGTELNRTNNVSTTMGNSLVYTDSYTISQLNTTDDGRVFQCQVVINASPAGADTVTLDVNEITPSTLEMTSSMIMTTTTISTTTSISMVTMATTSSDTMVATSSIATTPTPSAADNGGDDSDVGTIIGIILAIIVGVLLIILVILIIIVVIRNRNNRQGFYPTGEGKGGEEMILKYSASLRSITRSGAGAGGTENGGTINKATKKEQEYYI